jgi:P4 family phage/plasmid primase-like protien
MGTATPHRDLRAVARRYFDLGYQPIPLPAGAKYPPPEGTTGYTGRDLSKDDIDRIDWNGNIALRLNGVIGVDVDAYHGGIHGLAELEATYGPLPPTVVAHNGRGDKSGIRLYRVPVGTTLRTDPASGVDLVQWHHRYVVVAPSLHPDGRRYQWWDQNERAPVDYPPDVGDLTELPWAWIEGLAAVKSRKGDGAATPDQVSAFLDRHTAATRPAALDGIRSALANRSKGRHATLVETACWAFREAAAGHYPARDAERLLADWWQREMADDPRRRDGGEYGAALAWAVGEVEADPDRVDSIREREAASRPLSWSEAHVAETLADSLRGRYLWSSKLGWLRWDGRRWKPDDNEQVLEQVRLWVIDLGRRILPDATAEDLKHVASYKTAGRINTLAQLARRMDGIAVDPDRLDNQPGLLNALNGVIDLRTGELHPHDPSLLFTKVANAEYHPDARHPDVDAALEALPPGTRAFVQTLFGCAATGEASEDVAGLFDGPGANGKTTLLHGVRSALGDYARPIARELILRTGREEHPTAYAELHQLRLAFLEELPEDGVLRAEVLKALTGGGEVRARYVHKDAWSFRLTHVLIIATNYRPRVLTLDDAIWRRLRLVPFPYRYAGPGDEPRPGDRPRDPNLRNRLVRGREQRIAMLAWIVAGARRWYAEGLAPSSEVTAATASWRIDEDLLLTFLNEHLVPDPGGETKAGPLYERYREWAFAENLRPLSGTRFGAVFPHHHAVVAHRVERHERSSGRVYVGLRFRAPHEPRTHWQPSTTTAQGNAKPQVTGPVEGSGGLKVNPLARNALERFPQTLHYPPPLRLQQRCCPDCGGELTPAEDCDSCGYRGLW